VCVCSEEREKGEEEMLLSANRAKMRMSSRRPGSEENDEREGRKEERNYDEAEANHFFLRFFLLCRPV